MTINKKDLIIRLLKGIETGDPTSVLVVNEEEYIQHNPQTHEGSEGLAVLFKRLSKTSPRVNIVRAFEDGDFVFAHTEYDFANRNIGFEIFRFNKGKAVEHWDNIQKRAGPNTIGYSMVDGNTTAVDLDKTEKNRSTINAFILKVIAKENIEELSTYINQACYTEHNPNLDNKFKIINLSLRKDADSNNIRYKKCHRILAEGNFVLSVCEGFVNEIHSSLFDLFRLENDKIVEHWDTTEAIPPQSSWKNNNGKF